MDEEKLQAEIIEKWKREHTGVFCNIRARDLLKQLEELEEK